MIITDDEYLAHYGTPRHSGRYPWGSGGNQNTVRSQDFLGFVSDLKKQGLSESEIAKGFNISINQLRARKSFLKDQLRNEQMATAQKLSDKGMSKRAIAVQMFGDPKKDTTVANLLSAGAKDKALVLNSTANMLKEEVSKKGIIDIGSGVEHHYPLGISRTKLDTAVALLKEEGYEVWTIPQPQLGTGHDTKRKVLCPPGMKQKEAFLKRDQVQLISQHSSDGGRSYSKFQPPIKVNPDRIGVVYKEDGGSKADGMIYLRPGVDDLHMGGNRYAQVRIQVGDGHYLKGMAMYKDDLPEGTDILFNTSKSKSEGKLGVMKPLEIDKATGKVDKDLPFGALVTQLAKKDKDGKDIPSTVSSAINIVGTGAKMNVEGSWETWTRTLSSQMLSKQSPALIRSQLDMTMENRKIRLEQIKALSNPVVKKKMLEDFAEGTDKAAVNLKAAHLPRQGAHVILPLEKIKPNEVYAPRYDQGERVVLVRHPHGGPFEIPELTVNNRNPQGRRLLGDVPDAIGIHHSVAERLSGADFDGDTVLVIPNNAGRIKTADPLEGLKNFDPKHSYPDYPGNKHMTQTQMEMGKISNLITDMSLQGAPNDHLARAVRHSMVVIDAEKHKLDYRRSYSENNIRKLQDEYQTGGASTLISRAKSEQRVPHRIIRPHKAGGPIDEQGRVVFQETGKVNYRTGEPLRIRSEKLRETHDAHTLLSGPDHVGTPVERIYADHSNKLKGMANDARLTASTVKFPKQSESARRTYEAEVKSLNNKYTIVERNRPLERHAQAIAGAKYKAKVQSNPDMTEKEKTKVKFQLLEEARHSVGAKSEKVDITQEEWNAIQANAISASRLNQILRKADMDKVSELATPKRVLLMTATKTSRAKQMLDSGYTEAEVAKHLGVSLTTLKQAFA